MRWIVVIILAMIPLLTGYTVWPIYGLYRIASAVETRNSAALQELIDFPSLRASLAHQIADAHRKKLTSKSASSSERSESPLTAGVGATVVDALLAKIISNPQRLLDLLGKGWGSADLSPPGLEAPFTANSLGSAWQTWLNSDYSGRNFYVDVPVDSPSDQRFRIRLRLVHWDWKLSGLDLPESMITHLTQELMRRN
ncbi:MAG: DUF2939 domain-containing protein [Hyphomicrobiales bacterium]